MRKKKGVCWSNGKIPAELFFEVLESGKLKKLIRSGTPKNKVLKQAWKNIFDEFFIRKDDAQLRKIVRIKNNIIYLAFKIGVIENYLKVMSFLSMTPEMYVEVVGDLKRVDIYIDPEKQSDEEIKRVLDHDLNGFKTALKIEEDEYKNLSSGERANFETMCVSIENMLDRSIDENITLRKYIALEKSAKEKEKTLRKKK